MESILDDLAVKMGIDPVEMRLKNDPGEIRQREYKLGAERFGWKDKYQKPGSSPGVVKVGIGCAGSLWAGGANPRRPAQSEVQINPDGSVEVHMGVQDLGTGTRTVLAVIAAEVFGLAPEQITVKIGDTNYPPGPGSGGSTTCASVSPAVLDACTNALQQLQSQTGVADARGGNWTDACKKLGVTPLVAHGLWKPGLSSAGTGGVQFAEVAVDTETGLVAVKKLAGVHDCGLIINQITTESQIYGGMIMGMGYALYEERVMDWQSGVMLNPNFETYKVSGLCDIPEFDLLLLNMPERGVIGIGEPAIVPTAAAIANAVANALGVRVTSLPITPAKVLAALGKIPATAS
jgi:xanthine dehydrogenase YagR molybdenum-binding subunit